MSSLSSRPTLVALSAAAVLASCAVLAIGPTPALARPQAAPNTVQHWGGYVYAGGTGSVSASWTVPSVTCNSTADRFSQWVGIDGFGASHTVEQIGTRTTCVSGAAHYSAFSQMYPQEQPIFYEAANTPVYPGDQVSASVAFVRGSYQRTVTDDTQGWTVTAPASASAQNASAEVVVEAPTHSYADFGEADFVNATVNGQSLAAVGAQPVTADNGNGPQAVPGELYDSSFSVFYNQET